MHENIPESVKSRQLTASIVPLKSPISFRESVVKDVQLPYLYPVHNRRDGVPFLKNVFPSGFNVFDVRDGKSEMGRTKSRNLSKSESQLKTHSKFLNGKDKHPYSFTEWAKGDVTTIDDNFTNEGGDQYADVAGTYFKEISLNSVIPDPISDLPNDAEIPLVIQPCVMGHQTSTEPSTISATPLKRQSVPQEMVYMSTSVLPAVNPLRPSMKRCLKISKNKRKPSSSHQISDVHSGVSVHDIPRLLSDSIALELYTFRDMFGGRSVDETAAAVTRFRIDASISLHDIRHMVVLVHKGGMRGGLSNESSGQQQLSEYHDEMADSIGGDNEGAGGGPGSRDGDGGGGGGEGTGVRLRPASSRLADNSAKTGRIVQVDLHYYHSGFRSWRSLCRSEDWETAKLCALDAESPLQLAYTIVTRESSRDGRQSFESLSPSSHRNSQKQKPWRKPSSSDIALLQQQQQQFGGGDDRLIFALEDESSSVGGVSRVSVSVSVRSMRSNDDNEGVRFAAPNAPATPYKPKSVYLAPQSKNAVPIPSKQRELALALEQRLMLRNK